MTVREQGRMIFPAIPWSKILADLRGAGCLLSLMYGSAQTAFGHARGHADASGVFMNFLLRPATFSLHYRTKGDRFICEPKGTDLFEPNN